MISRRTIYIMCAIVHMSFTAQVAHAGLWEMVLAPFARLAAYAKQRPALTIASVVSSLAICGGIYWWYKTRPTQRQKAERALRINEDLCAKVRAAKELLTNMRTIDLKNNLIQGLDPLFKDIRVYRYPSDLEFARLDGLFRRMLGANSDVDLAGINETIVLYLDENILRDLTQNCTCMRKELAALPK